MKHFSHLICCLCAVCACVAAGSTLAPVSAAPKHLAVQADADTLQAVVDGKTLYCTYQRTGSSEYHLTLVNFDSIGQYPELASAFAQEIYLNHADLFHSNDQLSLIVDYPYERDSNLVVRFQDCFFDFDQSVIREDFFATLDHAAEVIISLHEPVVVCGYTDNKGRSEYNLGLSLRRARAVRAYLIRRGVNPKLISARGYGSEHPIDSNDTDEGRSHNRRCEIRLQEE